MLIPLHCHLTLNITFKTTFGFVLTRHAVGLMMVADTSKPSIDTISVLLGQLKTTTVEGLTVQSPCMITVSTCFGTSFIQSRKGQVESTEWRNFSNMRKILNDKDVRVKCWHEEPMLREVA